MTGVGYKGVIILVLYAVFLLTMVTVTSAKKGIGSSMKKFYLGGEGLGAFLLFFTLYATQYSGNTVVGYPAKTYRVGFSYYQSIPFFIMIIVGYLLFAPRLHVLAKRHNFVTPADWLHKRFNSKPITILGTILMAYGLSNYLLEQLVAIGQAITGLTAGAIPYQYGVIFLVIIMLIYESLGGMKGVAVADATNGIVLLIGVFGFLILAIVTFGGLGGSAEYMIQNVPEKIGVPDTLTLINWASIYILVGVGAAVYPHAIQRIYAADSENSLKKSLKRMAWMPFFTSGVVFLIGIMSIKAFPGLDKGQSEQIVGMMANAIASKSAINYWIMMILYTGIVGAIMSTADSVILALSSLLSNDIYGRFINENATEKQKVKWGKIAGIIIVFILLILAWNPPGTLYEIFILKFEILLQVAPAFLIGLYWNKLERKSVLAGMIAGAVIASTLTFIGMKTIVGIHGGVIGLTVNILICVVGSKLAKSNKKEEETIDKLLNVN